jgi:hypothetical protein
MSLWQGASLAFFTYVILIAAWRGGRRAGGRRSLAGSVAGVSLVFAGWLPRESSILAHWILPPLVLLIAYWASGALFIAPNERQERALMSLDRRLGIVALARRAPRLIADLLETSYVGVYPLVPLALVIHVIYSARPNPSRFWAVILIIDFICFGVLPWVQTRPPRALETSEPWSSPVRRFNLRLLESSSIQVNTFPSGHAAEALAAALLTLNAPAPVALFMWIAAIGVSAGAVLGRYHYAADALTGWAVALAVWMIV